MASDLINNLVEYINDIKPYHTKIHGVEVEYIHNEDVNLTISEDVLFKLDMGLPICDIYHDSDIVELCVDDGRFNYNVVRNEIDYQTFTNPPTGFYDVMYATITETLSISMGMDERDIDDKFTDIDYRWDDPLDGFAVVRYGNNSITIPGDVVDVFITVDDYTFSIIGSTHNDGVYQVISASFSENDNETTIIVTENNMDPSFSDGIVQVGLYDSREWEGDESVRTPQPVANLYADTSFSEGLMITDGYGWDDPSVGGWDSTVDDDYVSPSGHEHDFPYFDDPDRWDDGYNIIDSDYGGSTIGWDKLQWDVDKWDNNIDISINSSADPDGIVIFSANTQFNKEILTTVLFTQPVTTNTWYIDHRLFRYPKIDIIVNGEYVQPVEIIHTTNQHVTVVLPYATTGIAKLM